MGKPFIEQALRDAFAPLKLEVIPCRTSMAQWFMPQRRWFLVRKVKGYRRVEMVGKLAEYAYSDRFPWPTGAQVRDPEWLRACVSKVAASVSA
jgi:hypothetical protein